MRAFPRYWITMPRSFAWPIIAVPLGVLLGVWVASGAEAPPEFFTRSWLADEGLPTTAANDVAQDADGFLWVATAGGLARFDGVRFKPFASPLIAKVAARNVRALATAGDGSVLILPAVGGLVELRHDTFRKHPAAAGLEGTQLRGVFVERSGAIWLDMEGGRVRRWQNGRVEDFGAVEGFNERARISFAESANGEVWVASGGFVGRYQDGELRRIPGDQRFLARVASSSSGGVWVYKGTRLRRMEGDQESIISTNLPWAAAGGVVRVMYEDREGALWIGTAAHGLFRWANGGFTQAGAIHSQITSILEDAEGNLWVTSEGSGLTRLRSKTFQLFDSSSGIAEDASDSVSADAMGNVWVANRGGGVARIADNRAEAIRTPEGSHKLRAYAVCADDGGGVWVSEDSLYRFKAEPPYELAALSNGFWEVHALFRSRNSDLWASGEDGLLGRYAGCRVDNFMPEPDFKGSRVRCITEDSAGRIWIGTESGRLYRKDGKQFAEFGAPDGLPEAPIRTLYGDATGGLWIGTAGGGLVLARNGKFTCITEDDGLPDDHIGVIVEDDHGRLWFGSRSGIFYVARAHLESFAAGTLPRLKAVTFGRSEGLQGVSCVGSVQPMACKTSDGRLWFATRQGVLSLDVNRMKINHKLPPVLIDEVLANNRPLAVADGMRVPPLCKRIEFRFAVLSFAAPEKVRLSYLLEGADSDWTEVAGRREAVYMGLQPGRYHLRVRACNSDGIWNEAGATLKFTVQATWWQLWWVRGLGVALGAIALGAGVRKWSHRRLRRTLERLEQQQVLERERMRIARDLHDDLGATVTQVGMLVEELAHTPPEKQEWTAQAGEVSSRVRRLARDLDAVVWSVNPSNDSLNSLSSYLSQFFLETLRHSTIRPRLQVEEGIPTAPLKPDVRHHFFLITKEALNNILKHSHATEATLGIAMDNGHFEVRIQDNGRGFDVDAAARSHRNGLRNMRARAEEMGCAFDVSSRPGAGTMILVRLQVPPDPGGQG